LKLLLDTNTLIWLIGRTDGKPLGPQAVQNIQAAEVVYVSSVSILEIRIKTMLGKLAFDDDLIEDIMAAGVKELSFGLSHADAIRDFPALSRHDPFDRMLLAQAKVEKISFLTTDDTLLKLQLPDVIDARQ
jgi:PIN domain nuclease of toxin-antitoxin system